MKRFKDAVFDKKRTHEIRAQFTDESFDYIMKKIRQRPELMPRLSRSFEYERRSVSEEPRLSFDDQTFKFRYSRRSDSASSLRNFQPLMVSKNASEFGVMLDTANFYWANNDEEKF